MAQADVAGPVRLHLWLARLRAASAGGCSPSVVVYQTVTGTNTPKPAASQPIQGPPAIGAVGTSILDAPPRGLAAFDANLPAGTLPDGGPFTEAGDKTWHVVPGTTPQVGQGTAKVFRYTVEIENGLDPIDVRRRQRICPDGRPDAGQSEGLDAQSAIRLRPDRQRQARLPDFAGVPGDGAGGLRLRISAGDVLLQPGFRAGQAAAGDHQRGALGARSGAVRRRRRVLPAVRDQPRGRPCHRLRAPSSRATSRVAWRR